jgi:oxygen-independent coproporphyrinogen-3 oxidase
MNELVPMTGVERSKVQAIHDYIDRKKHERQVNKILHGFPSPRLWYEKEIPIKAAIENKQAGDLSKPNRFWLYVSTPYCLKTDPDKCGYCLFPVEVFAGMGQLDTYLNYLEKEIQMYQGMFENAEIITVFFGGGTPNLYKESQYARLIGMVRKLVPNLKPDVPMILEGIPQLFTREKLVAMKDAGVTRISMGAQQLNEDLNKLSGRKQKARHVFQALEWCEELGLQSNVDLIFGWPRQTVDTMLEDLETLVKTPIRHITHYELNVAGGSDFALNRFDELPTVTQNLEMYHASRKFLEGKGFRQLSVYDWDKPQPGAYVFTESIREFDTWGIFGLGYAAVSYFPGSRKSPGWTYVNHRSVTDYFADLDRNRLPIERGYQYSSEDLKLSMLCRNLLGMEANLTQYQALFQSDLLAEFAAVWQALVERGWAEISGGKIQISGDGVYYIPMIATLLCSDRNEAVKRELKEKLSSRTVRA